MAAEQQAKLAKKSSDRVAADEKIGKKKWRKPTLEDVSGKVMAQPYIRFT